MTCRIVPSLPAASIAWRTDDHAVRVLGGEPHLVLGQQLDALAQDLLRLLDADLSRPGGVEVLWQPDPAAGLDPEGRDEFGDALRTDIGHWEASGIWVAPLARPGRDQAT